MKIPLIVVIFCICVPESGQQNIIGCDTNPADVIFLLDSSGSVGDFNFELEKKFVIDFTQAVHIGPHKVQVGVISYSFYPTHEIRLNQYSDEYSLRNAIRNIQYNIGSTNTDLALREVFMNGFIQLEGDRTYAPNVLVVLTDGLSFDRDQTVAEAKRLHASGVTVYAIGIGSEINRTEIALIATDMHHAFFVSDFNALHTLQTDLHPIACGRPSDITSTVVHTHAPVVSTQATDQCSSSPCKYGRCFHDTSDYFCLCQQGYHGKNCDKDVCSNSPCQNGGRCFENGPDYLCSCSSGFVGKNCDIATTPKPDVCSTSPCQNGGRCFANGQDYVCSCSYGFNGKNCEIAPTTKPDVCSTSPCQNGGRCFANGQDYLCSCITGFNGKHCEIAPTTKPAQLLPLTFGPNIFGRNARQLCNKLDVLVTLKTGKGVTMSGAKDCNGTSADALLMKHCNAPMMTSWKKGVQVISNCSRINAFEPIAQWQNDRFTDMAGVFISCQNGIVQMVLQSCMNAIAVHSITVPAVDTLYTVIW